MPVYELVNPKWPDEKGIVVVCDCSSHDHQLGISYIGNLDPQEVPEIYMTFHLHSHDRFLPRLWRGIRYAFGYRSQYGDWDEIVLSPEDAEAISHFLTAVSFPSSRRDIGRDYRNRAATRAVEK